jgi:hypothetical protein
MKYIITESKLDNVIIKYLDIYYGDLKEVESSEYPDSTLYVKDNRIYMKLRYGRNGRTYLSVSSDIIWLDLEKTFKLDFKEVEDIITKWAKKTYDIPYSDPARTLFAHDYEPDEDN